LEERRFPRSELVQLLSPAIGEEKAEEAIVAACLVLALGADAFDRDQALDVLEAIAQSPGLVGITARFAKSRVHLKW
jgi:hypothetical protein